MKNVLFTPLDFDVNLTNIPHRLTNGATHVMPSQSPFWKYEQLLTGNGWESNLRWRDDLGPFQQQLKILVDQLPFVSLQNVRWSIQTKVATPHLDVKPVGVEHAEWSKYVSAEPCGYRFLLHGSCTALKIHTGGKVYTPVLPHAPCGYIINSSKAIHSVDHDPNRMTLYIRGFIDVEKHKRILLRSIKKYSNQVIYDEE